MALTPGVYDLDLHAGLLHPGDSDGRDGAPLPWAEPKPRFVFAAVASLLILVSLCCALLGGTGVPPGRGRPFVVRGGLNPVDVPAEAVVVDGVTQPRGVREGVSSKSSGVRLDEGEQGWPWTYSALQWQRTAYHFQPEKNWMNDPNAPLWHKGWYHLFYQYNPDSPVWGNITWGHAVSRDLIHWLHLPLAMVRDRWYDAEGVFTGSATFLADGTIAVLYTGSTDDLSQVQCLARPTNQSDPLLLDWVKHDANPVLVHPHGIDRKDFRDPSTAWYVEEDSTWRIAIGTKDDSTGDHSGFVLVYSTRDFLTYELLPGKLHAVAGTGMWECIDFYPVSADPAGTTEGLDTSTPAGPGVKHVVKASLDDEKHDYYAIGTYDAKANTWTPDDPETDVGIGLRYDYGKYYASKTFYDQVKKRRILWGWTGETDSEAADYQKGWASVQTIPRTVLLDYKTGGANLVLWPVEEVESLRKGKSVDFKGVHLAPGSVVALDVGEASQLDITAEFHVDISTLDSILEADVTYNCSTSGGASGRGALGPFGLLVLTHPDLDEQTAVYFYIAKRPDGTPDTFICHDELRSSRANDIIKRVYGSVVPMLEGEKLTVRLLVDHSIVETFAQGGRACVTSRIYPTTALYGDARLFLFNNATAAGVTATDVKVWRMGSASIKRFPFDQPESIPK